MQFHSAPAFKLGNPRGANMVALGAYIGMSRAIEISAAEELVHETFAQKPKLVDVNLKALRAGYDCAQARPGAGAEVRP